MEGLECQDFGSCYGHYMLTERMYCGCAIVEPYCDMKCWGYQAVPQSYWYQDGYSICFETTGTCGTCPADQTCANWNP